MLLSEIEFYDEVVGGKMEPEVKNGTFLFLVFPNKMKNKSSSEIYWRATQGLEQETSPKATPKFVVGLSSWEA